MSRQCVEYLVQIRFEAEEDDALLEERAEYIMRDIMVRIAETRADATIIHRDVRRLAE
jgi:hypothetical protein